MIEKRGSLKMWKIRFSGVTKLSERDAISYPGIKAAIHKCLEKSSKLYLYTHAPEIL